MADASRSELPRRAALGVVDTWRRLNFEQRVAGIGALLLVVSTFGPYSFVEAALALTGVAILFLLRKRAIGREFHIPFGDGGVIAAAGAWSALLIVVRLPDRPLGQTLLALVCAGILLVAGVAERRKHLPDDLPGPAPEAHQRGPDAVEWEEPTERLARGRRRRSGAAAGAPTPRMGSPRPDGADTSPLGEPRPREDDTSPLGERRPRVGSSDAPTEVRGRRRRQRPRAETDTEPLAEPGAAGAPAEPEPPPPGAQLELPDPPLPPAPRGPNDPLPPPEFHLPGEDDDPPPPPPRD